MTVLHTLLLLMAVFRTATPVSTSFPVPSILTPHLEVAPPFHASPRNVGFSVASLSYWGELQDYSINSSYSISRGFSGPPTLCSIQNRTFWFSGETSFYDSSHAQVSASSSVAIALSYSHPSWIREISARPPELWPAIPLTPEEEAVGAAYNIKFDFQPSAHAEIINSTSAIQILHVSINRGTCTRSAGRAMAIYTLDPDTNTLTVTRQEHYQKDFKQYPYGSFSVLTVEGTTYLYALDPHITGDEYYDGYQKDLHVAAAPASSVTDKSTWKYYDNSTGTWSATEPLPTDRRRSAAIFVLDDPPLDDSFDYIMSGSIFYSEYHNAYLLVYASIADGRYFRVRYSATPLGPFSDVGKVIMDTFAYNKYPVNSLVSPLFQVNGYMGGKTLLLNIGNSIYRINFA